MNTSLQLGLFETQRFCERIKEQYSSKRSHSTLLITAAYLYDKQWFVNVTERLNRQWYNTEKVLELIIEEEYREHVKQVLYGEAST